MESADIKKSKRIYWASGIVSICGIVFEVLFGALGSYMLGDGVKQYTLTISLFLTGMGIGSFLSEKVMRRLMAMFITIEFLIALIGGFSVLLMFGVTAYIGVGTSTIYLYAVIIAVGLLTGLELPILIRKATEIGVTVNKSTARVLFTDYAGGLIGGILFVLWLRPEFGLVKTAFLVAIVNATVALLTLFSFRDEIRFVKSLSTVGGLIGLLLIAGVIFGDSTAFSFEKKLYKDPIIYHEESAYQNIVMTKEQGDLRLYLDGNLQFSSTDEYRYHEVLIHPTMALAQNPKNVLVLGGGDGLAARELLKYDDVTNITLVDLDPAVTDLGKKNPKLLKMNNGSMNNDRVNVVNEDAFNFMKEAEDLYDAIIVDLPDPNNVSLSKLYTKEFYSLLRNHLSPSGAMVVQATSPVFATKAYWTIDKTVASTGLHTENLHVDIPSFGNWGFVLASRQSFNVKSWPIPVKTKYLTSEMLPSLSNFGKDIDKKIIDDGKKFTFQPNTLIHPNIMELYQQAWKHY